MGQQLATTFVVEVEGSPLPAGHELAAVVVDRSRHVPDLFALSFKDPGRAVIGSARLRIGARVVIKVRTDAEPVPRRLVEGEITSLELSVDTSGRSVVARGYDLSHRLHRARTTAGYRDVSYADVAARVARRNGLQPGTLDATPVAEHVGQVDQTDWAFLRGLADEVGHELVVDGDRLHFRVPTTAEKPGSPIDLTVDEPLTLVVGSSLLRLHAAVRSIGQAIDVEARGWDLGAKKAVSSIVLVDAAGTSVGTTSAEVAAAVGAGSWAVGSPRLDTQFGVDREALVTARAVADGLAELEGTARGNPRLAPGVAVQVGQAGAPFDGRYVLSAVRHTMDPVDGYVTHFTVSGPEDRSLLALTASGPSGSANRGVVPAVVTDVADPSKVMRVRVRYPWLSEDYESGWVRVVQLGAGPGRGVAWLPEVGDEVLVALEDGDLSRPYVLGGVYNGVDQPAPPIEIDETTHEVVERRLMSRGGSMIAFADHPNVRTLALRVGENSLELLHAEGDDFVRLVCKGQLQLEAESIQIAARTTLKIEAANVDIAASSRVNLAGATTKITGQPIELN